MLYVPWDILEYLGHYSLPSDCEVTPMFKLSYISPSDRTWLWWQVWGTGWNCWWHSKLDLDWEPLCFALASSTFCFCFSYSTSSSCSSPSSCCCCCCYSSSSCPTCCSCRTSNSSCYSPFPLSHSPLSIPLPSPSFVMSVWPGLLIYNDHFPTISDGGNYASMFLHNYDHYTLTN